MDKYFNKYNDESSYNADSARKGLGKSTVSLVGTDVVYDGVNVEVEVPNMGDAVYHDGKKNVHFIALDTLDKSKLPSDYVAVGVCGPRTGSKIYVVAKETKSQKFSQYFRWKVSGWSLDGSPHKCSVTMQSVLLGDFTYTASTIEECATQLDTWLRANSKPEKPHMAYLKNGEVFMQLCKYNSWSDYNGKITGLTVEYAVAQELPQAPSAVGREKDRVYPVWNHKKAIKYFESDLGSTSYNPSNVVSSVPSYPVCLPAYLGTSKHRDGDKCEYLRKRFGEGREGWENYLYQVMPLIPYPKGMMSDEYLTGKEATYRLAGQTAPDLSNPSVPLYQAADYAASIGFEGVKGFEKGDWFCPNAKEYIEVCQHLTYGLSGVAIADSDPMNRTLNRMGVGTLTCDTNSWLCSRYSDFNCWNAYSLGYVDYSSFCYSSRVVPMALYELCSE